MTIHGQLGVVRVFDFAAEAARVELDKLDGTLIPDFADVIVDWVEHPDEDDEEFQLVAWDGTVCMTFTDTKRTPVYERVLVWRRAGL